MVHGKAKAVALDGAGASGEDALQTAVDWEA